MTKNKYTACIKSICSYSYFPMKISLADAIFRFHSINSSHEIFLNLINWYINAIINANTLTKHDDVSISSKNRH